MSKAYPPKLKKYTDNKVPNQIELKHFIEPNLMNFGFLRHSFLDSFEDEWRSGGRAVEGVLRGFDPFMNLVIDDAIEFTKAGDKNYIGMVVLRLRGNSVVMLEAKDRLT